MSLDFSIIFVDATSSLTVLSFNPSSSRANPISIWSLLFAGKFISNFTLLLSTNFAVLEGFGLLVGGGVSSSTLVAFTGAGDTPRDSVVDSVPSSELPSKSLPSISDNSVSIDKLFEVIQLSILVIAGKPSHILLVEHQAVTREVISSTPAGRTLRVFK